MRPLRRAIGRVCTAVRRPATLLPALLLPALLVPLSAFATDEETVEFDIARQPVNTALTAFARQAGIPVLFPFDRVSHLTANPLKGEYSVEEGLEILLEGIGLEAGFMAGQLTVRIAEKPARTAMTDPRRAIERPPPATPRDELIGAVRLEEIIVTARLREQNLQEVPSAVSAISSEKLAANSADDVLDVAAWAPNVTFDQLGQGYGATLAASIRGLGYGDFKATSDPTVVFYVDDVVLSRSTGAILDLLDLERVEVFRGPQGTMFGKNAIGGVVRLVSRQPNDGERNGYLELTRGEFDRIDVRGSFETVLVPNKLFSRLSFASKQRNGHMDNVDFRCAMIRAGTPELAGVGDGIVGWNEDAGEPIMGVPFSPEDNAFAVPSRFVGDSPRGNCIVGRLGDQSVRAARGMLRFTPNDLFELNFSADVTDQRDTSPYELTSQIAKPRLTEQYNAETALPAYGVPYDTRFVAPDRRTSYAGFELDTPVPGGVPAPNVNDVKHWGASSSLDFRLDDLAVRLVLAHREFDAFFGQDADGSPLALNHFVSDVENVQDTVELRVSGTAGRWLSWTTGLFRLESTNFDLNVAQQVPCVYPMSCIERLDSVWSDHSAVFFDGQTDLTDRLSLGFGLRRSDDEKQILQERFDRTGAACCGFEGSRPISIGSANTDRMLSLTYRLADETVIYGTYQEGHRSGGTTARPTATTRIPFGPETLENVEIGLKASLRDDRMRVNAAVFDMAYRDIQQTAAGFDALGQLAFVTTNAGEASINGFELELQFIVGDHWSLDASMGHIDYELLDLGNASPEALLAAGLTVSNAADLNDGPNRSPKYSMSVNVGYFASLPNDAGLSVRYGASWRDDAWWGVQGDRSDPANLVPAHALTNFRVTWASPSREWEAALFCTNCTNERTTSSRLDFLALTGHLSETYVRPAEWGMSVKRIF